MPTPEQLARIQEGIRTSEEKLAVLDKEIKDAERAGIVDPARRERYTELKAKVRQIKAVYGE